MTRAGRTRAPARVRRSDPAKEIPAPTRLLQTRRGPVMVGPDRHELTAEDVSRAYHGGIFLDPIDCKPSTP